MPAQTMGAQIRESRSRGGIRPAWAWAAGAPAAGQGIASGAAGQGRAQGAGRGVEGSQGIQGGELHHGHEG
eukprot:15196366-Alexandrium_andersonii.AAC.1